jgi:hypothetical protein
MPRSRLAFLLEIESISLKNANGMRRVACIPSGCSILGESTGGIACAQPPANGSSPFRTKRGERSTSSIYCPPCRSVVLNRSALPHASRQPRISPPTELSLTVLGKGGLVDRTVVLGAETVEDDCSTSELNGSPIEPAHESHRVDDLALVRRP